MKSKNKLLLFIHGFRGSPDSFGNFKRLIDKDKTLDNYKVEFFKYPTSIFFIPFVSGLPKIQSISNTLSFDIRDLYSEYNEIVLVCHSMGGLIAKKYLLSIYDSLKIGQSNIKKVILYATPNNGSDFAKLAIHPQIMQLNKNRDFLELLNEDFISKKITDFIDILYVVGSNDKIVDRSSASNFWDKKEEIHNKNHFLEVNICGQNIFGNSIVKPKNSKDYSYRVLKEFILKKKNINTLNQPILYIQDLIDTESQRLNYKSSFIPYMKRENETKGLNKFLEEKDEFLWFVLYESGGTGKSRLAFEYAKEIKKQGVYTGFFDPTSNFSWDNWFPYQDTFIIIDYAGSNIERVKEILEKISARKKDFNYKVRLLLLERTLGYPNDWYNKLFNGSGNTNKNDEYANPLPITPLDNNSLYLIAKQFCNNIALTKSQFIENLEEIDVKKRPLFAALLGDALNSSDKHQSSNKTTILKNYMERTFQKYWQNIEPEYLVLSMIITMCSQIDFNKLNIDDGTYLPHNENFDKEKLLNLLIDSNDTSFIGLQPDLIGEYFVLEFLNVNNKLFHKQGTNSFNRKKVEFALNYAWKNESWNMAVFVNRCRQDFMTHSSLKNLIDIAYINQYDEMQATYWSLITYTFIDDLREESQEQTKVFQSLEKLQNRFSKNENIALSLAKANYNLRIAFIEQPKELYKVLQKLEVLQNSFSKNEEIALLLTHVIVNLINALKGETKEQLKIFQKLETLQNNFSKNEEIALVVAVAYCNFINFLINKPQEQFKILQELEALQNSFSKNKKIAFELAKAKANLIIFLTGQPKEQCKIFQKLEALQKSFSKNDEIALVLADVSIHLINGFKGQPKEQLEILHGLEVLQESFSKNENIALSLAKANYNLMLGLRVQPQEEFKVFQKIEALQKNFYKNDDIALALAKSGLNLVGGLRVQPQEEFKIFQKIEALQKNFSKNDDIALALASANYNLMLDLKGQPQEQFKIFKKIEALQKGFSTNDKIALLLAKSSSKLIQSFKGQPQEQFNISQSLEAIQKIITKNKDIQKDMSSLFGKKIK